MAIEDNEFLRQEESFDQFIERVTQPSDKTHLIGMFDRPGIVSFFAAIEYMWFPPGTAENDKFDLTMVKWEDMLWQVLSLPNEQMTAVRELASELRLRIANGVPTLIGGVHEPGDGMFQGMALKYFPGSRMPDGKNNMAMFAIENAKDNPLHQLEDRPDMSLVRNRESAVVDAFERGAKPEPIEIYNFIYGFDPNPKWI